MGKAKAVEGRETRDASGGEAGKSRRDQWVCPRCEHVGCPRYSQHGSRMALYRYRRCDGCGHTFSTMQPLKPGTNELMGHEELR